MAGPKPGSTTAQGRRRREQILDAALEAFAANGYRGASMADIAERVGISLPGVLHHFASKRDLLLEVVRLQGDRIRALVYASAPADLSETFIAMAQAHESDPTFLRFWTTIGAESQDPSHPAHDWFAAHAQEIYARAVPRIRAEQAEGHMRADISAEDLASLVMAVIDGLHLQFVRDGGFPLSERVRSFVQLLRG
jgi:AcrR family transcriptional regulator